MRNDPIIAQATAPGAGGIGIIRISAQTKEMDQIIEFLFPEHHFRPRYAHLLSFQDVTGNQIDQLIAILFKGPKSYTGEDILELHAHGGPFVLSQIQDICLRKCQSLALRRAEPGEFTMRAFLNEKMDLTQAEAVSDLINARSQAAVRSANRSLQGGFSKRITELDEKLTTLRVYVEAVLDFPEEEIDFSRLGQIEERISAIRCDLSEILLTARRSRFVNDGLRVVLAGAPNVGKSSLMNYLMDDDVAIVTDIPGTTRDKIEEDLIIDGLPLRIIDTAGIRKTDNPIEQLGIKRTLEAISKADVVINLTSANETEICTGSYADQQIEDVLPDNVVRLNVVNKIDLISKKPICTDLNTYLISAKQGDGIPLLINKLKSIAGIQSSDESDFSARKRHLDCLISAEAHLEIAMQALSSISLDIVAEELRLASLSLGDIVGITPSDELLGKIFSEFCIGK